MVEIVDADRCFLVVVVAHKVDVNVVVGEHPASEHAAQSDVFDRYQIVLCHILDVQNEESFIYNIDCVRQLF